MAETDAREPAVAPVPAEPCVDCEHDYCRCAVRAAATKREPCPDCGCPGETYDGHVCEDYAASVAYDLEERIERIETLLSCIVIHGDNLPSFDQGPKVAREIIAEIQRELSEANDARP